MEGQGILGKAQEVFRSGQKIFGIALDGGVIDFIPPEA
jgi:hypothetical protein